MPAWNMRDIEELSGNTLQWSTVVESHAKKHNTKSGVPNICFGVADVARRNFFIVPVV